MANGAGGSITPYFTIWTEPRATIRRIVDTNPTRNVIALAAIGPAISALSFQCSKAKELGSEHISLAMGHRLRSSQASSRSNQPVCWWRGFKMDRKPAGRRRELRRTAAAIAWPQVIKIGGGILGLLIWIVLGMPVPHLTPGTLQQIDSPFPRIAVVGGLVGGAFVFWELVVWLKCIGEVHRFSAWRALAATLIPGLIGFAAFVFIDSALGPLLHHRSNPPKIAEPAPRNDGAHP